MLTIESINHVAPFNDELIPAPFDKGLLSKTNKALFSLSQKPEVIIRVDSNYDAFFFIKLMDVVTAEEKYEKYLAARETAQLLTNNYGIKVVKHHIVIGSNPTNPDKPLYFVVSEKIEGQNLSEIEYGEEEKPAAAQKLTKFYSSLVNYAWDLYTNGGWLIDMHDELGKNKQFVYGKRMAGAENDIWLVDFDSTIEYYKPRHSDQFIVLKDLIDMVAESEHRLGQYLPEPRQKMLQLVSTVPGYDRNYQHALSVRRKLADSTAPTEKQLAQEFTETMLQYEQIFEELEVSDQEYQDMIEGIFKKNSKELEAILTNLGTVQHTSQGDMVKDGDDYRRYVLNLYERQLKQLLYQKFINRLGEETQQMIQNRFGFTLLHDYIKKAVSELLGSDQKSIDLAKPSLCDKLHNLHFVEVGKKLGWEDNILPHFANILDIMLGDSPNEVTTYYLPLALNALGWDYQFQYLPKDIQATMEKEGFVFGDPDDFDVFIHSYIKEQAEMDLNSKLAPIENQFGKQTVDSLLVAIASREVDRITQKN